MEFVLANQPAKGDTHRQRLFVDFGTNGGQYHSREGTDADNNGMTRPMPYKHTFAKDGSTTEIAKELFRAANFVITKCCPNI